MTSNRIFLLAFALLWEGMLPSLVQSFSTFPTKRYGDATQTRSLLSVTATAAVNDETSHVGGTPTPNIRLNVFEKARTVTSICTSGTMCTLSSHDGIEGAPFGSFVDYVLDDEGNPVLLFNDMSMHTINIQNELENDGKPMVTLFTQLAGRKSGAGGMQDVSRCSLTGVVEKIPSNAPDMDIIRMRYSLTHAYADQVMDSPRFAFYRLIPSKIYYVGGFGVSSQWVEPEAYRDASPDILAIEASEIVERVNREHSEDLRLTAEHVLSLPVVESIRMTNVDRLGMDIRVTCPLGTRRNKLQTDEFRIGFRIPVMSTEDAKSEILKIFQDAWEKGNGFVWEGEESEVNVPIEKIAADSLE